MKTSKKDKKIEKIIDLTAALIRVIDAGVCDESLAKDIKSVGDRVLISYSKFLSGKTDEKFIRSMLYDVDALISLLSVAQKISSLKEINFTILKNEYLSLKEEIVKDTYLLKDELRRRVEGVLNLDKKSDSGIFKSKEIVFDENALVKNDEVLNNNEPQINFETKKQEREIKIGNQEIAFPKNFQNTKKEFDETDVFSRNGNATFQREVADISDRNDVSKTLKSLSENKDEDSPLNNRQKIIVEIFKTKKDNTLKINELKKIFPNISERTLRNDLKLLCSLGALKMEKKGRASFYSIADYRTLKKLAAKIK